MLMYIYQEDSLLYMHAIYECLILPENECEENNGGCEHRCKDLPYSFVCECDAGYQLSANGKNCIGTYRHS